MPAARPSFSTAEASIGLGQNTLIQDGANITAGVLTLFGDDADNTITLSRDAAG